MFKLQHPSDLISRLFILEYMRDIGPTELYKKANQYQKEALFYKFTDEITNTESVDLNWEALIFEVTLHQLEVLMSNFMEEMKNIDETRKKSFVKKAKEIIKKEQMIPTSINVMDLANTKIKESQDTSKLIV